MFITACVQNLFDMCGFMTQFDGRSVMTGGLCCVIACVKSPFDTLYLMTQFDGRSQLKLKMLLDSGQGQEEQCLAINFLHTYTHGQSQNNSSAGENQIKIQGAHIFWETNFKDFHRTLHFLFKDLMKNKKTASKIFFF